MTPAPAIPVIEPRSGDDVLAQLEAMRAGDTDWRGGRVFSLVYKILYGMAARLPVRGLVASRVRKVIAERYSHGRGGA